MGIKEIHRRPLRITSIAVNGDTCTGSSTVAKCLGEALTFTVHDIGRLVRRASQSFGYDNNWEALVSKWHQEIWNKGVRYINTPNTITEGRLVGFQRGNSRSALTILCVADEDVVLSRFKKRSNVSTNNAQTLLTKRRERDDQVLIAGWGVSRSVVFDQSLYDIVVDTSKDPLEKTINEILSFLKE